MNWLQPVDLATEAPIQTILSDANGVWALTMVDGVQTQPGHRILVKNEPSNFPFQMGIYEVQPNGDWVFVDEAEPGESAVLVTGGDENRDSIFVLQEGGQWLKFRESPEDRLTDSNGWDDDPLSLAL